MKKTDKIELRVDHAEKERLSSIAERRGQTVSDVVRDALAGELGAPRPNYPKWPGRVAIGAILLSVISLGLISKTMQGVSGGTHLEPVYPTSVSASIHAGDESVSFDIPTLKESKHELSLASKDGEIVRLVILSTPDSETGLLTLQSDACIVRNQGCDALKLQTVAIDTRSARNKSASVTTALGEDVLLVGFHAQTYWPEPAAN